MIAMDTAEESAKQASTQDFGSLGATISNKEFFAELCLPDDVITLVGSLERKKTKYVMLLDQVHYYEKYRNFNPNLNFEEDKHARQLLLSVLSEEDIILTERQQKIVQSAASVAFALERYCQANKELKKILGKVDKEDHKSALQEAIRVELVNVLSISKSS